MFVICFYVIGENINSPTANILTGSSPEVTEVTGKKNLVP